MDPQRQRDPSSARTQSEPSVPHARRVLRLVLALCVAGLLVALASGFVFSDSFATGAMVMAPSPDYAPGPLPAWVRGRAGAFTEKGRGAQSAARWLARATQLDSGE